MATAKKIPDNNYQVQLILSPKEARYLTAIAGCMVGDRPVQDIWSTLNDVVGPSQWKHSTETFNYTKIGRELRDWVENGE